MKKILEIFIKNYFLLILIVLPTYKINSASPQDITRIVGHWALSAGPLFADAIHYVALFSDDYASKVFGEEPAEYQTSLFVHHVLHECGVSHTSNIKVKLIKPEARDFVLSAIVCTDSTIFINPSIYNFLSKNEQRALIAQAAIMMQKNHIGTNAAVLAFIPIATHFITESTLWIIKQTFENSSQEVQDSPLTKTLYNGSKYVISFWATKLAINSILASLYFKYQARKYDVLTAKKLGTASDLVSYHSKLSELINKNKVSA